MRNTNTTPGWAVRADARRTDLRRVMIHPALFLFIFRLEGFAGFLYNWDRKEG